MDRYMNYAAFGFFFLSFLCYWVTRTQDKHRMAGNLLIFGFIVNLSAVIIRTIVSGHWPGTSLYEFGMVFTCMLALVLIVVERRSQIPAVMPFATAFLAVMNLITILTFSEPRQLMPALKSGWLAAHIIVAVAAYGLLAASFCSSLVYLWYKKTAAKAKTHSLANAAWLTDRLINLAMPFLTLVIVTGAIWAEYAWGTYWRWDPKETWALVTWLIYSAYLHFRLRRGYENTFVMTIAAVGFVSVLVTYLGVSFLLPGLHSYAW